MFLKLHTIIGLFAITMAWIPMSEGKPSSSDAKFSEAKKRFRLGKISKGQFFDRLEDLDKSGTKLSTINEASKGQIQALMLLSADFPVLAAEYAATVLRKADNPLKGVYRQAWYVLNKASERRSVQDIIERLAGDLKLGAKVPPGFGTDWFYYGGNADYAKGRLKAALQNYGRLKVHDRHFLSASYQEALIHLENGDLKRAEISLKAMLNSAAVTKAAIRPSVKAELENYAKMGLARLYYQQRQFKKAVLFYRAVDRESEHFYDSLFEQSWAFFMAGYPNHSLGALYSVQSPFFKEVYNPEASVLKAINYYWMCRYEDSRVALGEFVENHADSVEGLTNFLGRRRLGPKKSFELFEDFMAGVSSQSLGISRDVLDAAASEDSMLVRRAQYAATIGERSKYGKKGIYGVKSSRIRQIYDKRIKDLEEGLGEQFLVELKSLEKEYASLYEQSQFLYIELLMSEKEQLLGRELHASTKIDKVTNKKRIVGWAKDSQAWRDDKYNEFWWDEVGFYIVDLKPQCQSSK